MGLLEYYFTIYASHDSNHSPPTHYSPFPKIATSQARRCSPCKSTKKDLSSGASAFKINYDDYENDVYDQVTPLYNGNISETFWRSATDDHKRKYGYQYDQLNRLRYSFYQKPGQVTPIRNSYDEYIFYDKNGNITNINRFGNLDVQYALLEIDALTYKYDDKSNYISFIKQTRSFRKK